MGPAMDLDRHLGRGGLHQTEDLPRPVVHPVIPVCHAVPVPDGHVGRGGVEWVEASIAVDGPSGDTTPRLAELLLTEVLHMHLASAPAADQGRLAALRDPVLAPALAVLHRHPERRWTVADLADVAAVSRSTLDQRFRHLLGRPPMRYLTDWRMHVAKDLLAHTSLTVGAVADRVRYDAVEAFSRAFRRFCGLSPAGWRAERV